MILIFLLLTSFSFGTECEELQDNFQLCLVTEEELNISDENTSVPSLCTRINKSSSKSISFDSMTEENARIFDEILKQFLELCPTAIKKDSIQGILLAISEKQHLRSFYKNYKELIDAIYIEDDYKIEILQLYSDISTEDQYAFNQVMENVPFFLDGLGSDGSVFKKIAIFILDEMQPLFYNTANTALKICRRYSLFPAMPIKSNIADVSFSCLCTLVLNISQDRKRPITDLDNRNVYEMIKQSESAEERIRLVFRFLKTNTYETFNTNLSFENEVILLYSKYSFPINPIKQRSFEFEHTLPKTIFRQICKNYEESIAMPAFFLFNDFQKLYPKKFQYSLTSDLIDLEIPLDPENNNLRMFIRTKEALMNNEDMLNYFLHLANTHSNQ